MKGTANNQYAERDIIGLDRAGNYYCRHVHAMTAEGLHDKSDIAAELAWRDQEIDRLRSLQREAVLAPVPPAAGPAPNWCRTCGKLWSDATARLFCRDEIHGTAPRPTGTEDGEGWRTCRCGVGSIHYQKDCTTPARAEPGEAINAMVDRFLAWPLPSTVCVDAVASYYPPHPYPRTGTCLLSAVEARAMLEHVIGHLLHEEYQRGYEEGLRDNPDARGGGEAWAKLKALAEEWRIQAFELGTGHDMCANRNTMCRFITLIDQLHPTPAALDAEDGRATDAEIAAWVERHWLAINGSDARACFEDAQSVIAARATTGANGNG